MIDTKIPMALIFAMALQVVGGIWWVSQQSATITGLEETVSQLGSRMAIEENIHMRRDVQSNSGDLKKIWQDVDEVWDELSNLAGSINKITALQQRVALIENDLKHLSQGKE